MTTLHIPELCLVALVGVTGSGKSTFARRVFGEFEVLSGDHCRGLVSDDINDQDATTDAFDVLHYIAGKRLAAGKLTVVDATNVTVTAREAVVRLAREHDVLPVAVVLNPPTEVAVERTQQRDDRPYGADVVHRQAGQLRKTLKQLKREGFRIIHQLSSVEEMEAAQVVREKLLNDYRHEAGPFDIIGDVHGCRAELETLLTQLGYRLVRDDAGRPVDATHPAGRRVIFVGDLVDRGPDSPGVLRLAMGMHRAGHAWAVPGNHEAKLIRALDGKQPKLSHGLAETLEQLGHESDEFRAQVREWCYSLVSHLVLDEGRLVVAHAGLKEAYHGRASGRVRSFALYGDTTGETDEYGYPVRYPWAEDYRGSAAVVYGHTPTTTAEWINNTLCLDTGCVFGGELTALRYPEREIVAVPAQQVWYEPKKPLAPLTRGHASAGQGRPDDALRLTDVVGKRIIATEHLGKVQVSAEEAAGALEVMSRFALPPEKVPYLPPTMSPVSSTALEGYLEHPAEAFSYYASQQVGHVLCEEKHMGSRGVLVVHRGAPEDGSVYTRTGRAFFPAEVGPELLRRVDAALASAGLWDELGTDRVVMDAEILPWSLKAEDLVRSQYAAAGAAATLALPRTVETLEQAAARGLDVGELVDSTRARANNAEAYVQAYRRYVSRTEGLAGVQVAVFQVLATGEETRETRPHPWHLGVADRLVEADATLFRATRRQVVTLGDDASECAATHWWQELTDAGGEGMVVKPLANLTRGPKGLVQPGLKVRGREYLRIIYGPDYTESRHLERLRNRNVNVKRQLALREYALGLESLRRWVAGEPTWRVHEPVFAVLAKESTPVDPRL